MEQNQTEQLLRQPIAPKLTQNLEQIRTIAEGSSDLLVNEFVLSGLPAALLCCEGMLATSIITELILNPITKIALECPTAAKSPALFHRPGRGKNICRPLPVSQLRFRRSGAGGRIFCAGIRDTGL